MRGLVVFLGAIAFTIGILNFVPNAPRGTLPGRTSSGDTAATTAEAARATPEAASRKTTKPLVRASKYMIVAANPLAAQTGREILAKGGSAVDAAIATQMVLALVEPQSSGIGGGGFMLVYEKITGDLVTYDGRETAPQAAQPNRFMGPDGKPLGFRSVVPTGLSVGVPGLVQMMAEAHKRYGRLPWAELLRPAIRLARRGFRVSPRLHQLLSKAPLARFSSAARSYFYDRIGRPRPVGYLLKNPKFAAVLEAISVDRGVQFYADPIARDLVSAINAAYPKPPIVKRSDVYPRKGAMTMRDFASYRVKVRAPVCAMYRGYRVCGMGPPSSGAHTVGQILSLLDGFSLQAQPGDVRDLHLIGEAQKLAFADRGRYLADPDFVAPPTGLLSRQYMSARRSVVSPVRAMGKAQPGDPGLQKRSEWGRDASVDRPGTTHLSGVDADGNAVSLTSSIETGFGSGIMVRGFLLNNQLTDFSFKPQDKDGNPIANRVQGGKRPRSSMAPTMVFAPDGSLFLVTGSPGGSRIINYVVKVIIATLDWSLDPQVSAAMMNFGSRNGPYEIEKNPADPEVDRIVQGLEAIGHKVVEKEMTSGIHTILLKDGVLFGGADPRREGIALGE